MAVLTANKVQASIIEKYQKNFATELKIAFRLLQDDTLKEIRKAEREGLTIAEMERNIINLI